MPQEQVKQVEPLRLVGGVNATRVKPVAAFVLVVGSVEIQVVRQEATRGKIRRVKIRNGNQD